MKYFNCVDYTEVLLWCEDNGKIYFTQPIRNDEVPFLRINNIPTSSQKPLLPQPRQTQSLCDTEIWSMGVIPNIYYNIYLFSHSPTVTTPMEDLHWSNKSKKAFNLRWISLINLNNYESCIVTSILLYNCMTSVLQN